ncbi:hypothetical protein DFH08DRAFT_885722 [Mycena albidolilacea]|uniref:Secreted protein n=1 Tax=Mycena albidolilacea TaxID=1033008 RepID=A0AAD6ZKL0_9AGAR|nr:hypothetical protein DFH08DRAFT_885722 [Mycena albidolilacea]
MMRSVLPICSHLRVSLFLSQCAFELLWSQPTFSSPAHHIPFLLARSAGAVILYRTTACTQYPFIEFVSRSVRSQLPTIFKRTIIEDEPCIGPFVIENHRMFQAHG